MAGIPRGTHITVSPADAARIKREVAALRHAGRHAVYFTPVYMEGRMVEALAGHYLTCKVCERKYGSCELHQS